VAAETLINWREVTRDFEHLAGVRLYHASCLLQDEDGIVHIWPEGYQYATSSDAHRPVFACGFAADSRVQHAPRGAWKQPQGLNLCRECGRVPGSPTSRAEKKESRDYEPLPRNWERSLNSERTRYSLRSEIEDSMRRMLGDIASTDANRVSEWNEANIRAQANYIYSNALRRVTRKLVAADVRLVVLRALNHPRRLFCETLHARLIRLELAAATQMLEKSAEDLFDMWLPRAPAAWSKRARLTRCADAAAQVEKELRYYGPPSLSECWWPKIEPDMATPSSQPPYAHRTKARPRPHK
jgi:hypothetical protein